MSLLSLGFAVEFGQSLYRLAFLFCLTINLLRENFSCKRQILSVAVLHLEIYPVFQANHNPGRPGWREQVLMLDYQVGDKVIHATHGLGEVVKIDEKFIHERQMLCYVVCIGDMTIWVMADEAGKSGLRLPTPRSDFGELFAILSSPGEPLPVDRFERRTHLLDRMKDGKLASICAVIRDLVFYRQVRKFNEYDKSTLERAKNLLISEWTYSLSVTPAQAKNELVQLIGAV
jgi:RNA polymerase-interacting CarD/CdnL/TRCF family regulator